MYDCKAPLSRFYYPDTRRIINAFIIIYYYYYTSRKVYQHMKYSYRKKQIVKRPYGAT